MKVKELIQILNEIVENNPDDAECEIRMPFIQSMEFSALRRIDECKVYVDKLRKKDFVGIR